jgi:chorismate mutase
MTDALPLESLGDLRVEIDRIDGEMHELLMQRGEIIDRLIAVKARQGGGSAFRPGREADMMRVIATRHHGRLPLDTVESIWRVIISTFTYVQSNYAVHADMSGGDAAMRDSARFHFGFTVPLRVHASPKAVIAAVGASARDGGDLGMLRAGQRGEAAAEDVLAEDCRWWEDLGPAEAPKIIARLPFVERPDHPAGMPVFIISNPLAEAAARDVALFWVRWPFSEAPDAATLEGFAGEILGRSANADCLSLLLSAPGDLTVEALSQKLGLAEDGGSVRWVGSHAERFSLS